MVSTKNIVIALMCILGTCIPQAASFRLKQGLKTDSKAKIGSDARNRQSKLHAPGVKVMVLVPGTIQMNNNGYFKEVDTGKGTTYNVKCDMEMKSGWIHHVKPASITLRGSAAWDPTAISIEWQSVTVKLIGTVEGVESGAVIMFKADGMDELLAFPSDFAHTLEGPVGVDYSVTEVAREGKPVFKGNAALFRPAESMEAGVIFKEFVIKEAVKYGSNTVDVETPLYVKGEGYCGTELFTTKRLTCALGTSLEDDVAIATRLAPTNNRGFGLEFELVSRLPPDEIEDEATKDFELNPLPSNVEQYTDEHAQNYNDPGEYEDVVKGVQIVNYCFRQSIRSSPSKGTCSKHTECKLNEFCTMSQVCKKRTECQIDVENQNQSIDKVCPVPLKFWNWESDVSVELLSWDEVDDMGGETDGDENEIDGVGMEIVAPGPPNVLSSLAGIQSAAEVLGILSRQGVQAGPSQGLHLHVNVLSSRSPGDKMDLRGIASVWAAWAKYQLPIDEMLSPGRPDNQWSGRLFFGAGRPWLTSPAPKDCRLDNVACTAMFFRNMHTYLKDHHDQVLDEPKDASNFCNAMFGLPGDETPCNDRYPHQRYSQVNLMPLTRYGTIEFRPHSATVKIERVARWVQFLTSFVEYFGNTPEGKQSTADFFDGVMEEDFGQLRDAQRSATLPQLFAELGSKVDGSSLAYYQERKWESKDAICQRQKTAFAKASTNLLELKNHVQAKKATTKAKGKLPTPVEILVPVPRED